MAFTDFVRRIFGAQQGHLSQKPDRPPIPPIGTVLPFTIQFGGYYTWEETPGVWKVWLLLDLFCDALHCSIYSSKFDHLPTLSEAQNADVLAMHVPIATASMFNMKNLQLLGGAPITPDDLIGYEAYLEATGVSEVETKLRINDILAFSKAPPSSMKLVATHDGLKIEEA